MRMPFVALVLLSACAGGGSQGSSAASPIPATVSRDHIRNLCWLEGRWATERNAYLMTYLDFSFTSDTSLQLRLFESREFMVPYNTFEVLLTDGRLRARSGVREWMATRVDSSGMHFLSAGGDVYEALGMSRLNDDRARIEITWRFESGQAERRAVTARRFTR